MRRIKRRRLPLFLMLVAAACLLLPATVLAQGGPRHGGGGQMANPGHLMKLADELDLRDDQREEIGQLLEEGREEIRPLRQEMRQEGRALRQMMSDTTVDRAEVHEQLEKVLELEAQVKRRRADLFLDMRDILDDDQRARAQELLEEGRGEMREQRQQRRQNRGEHRRQQRGR